MTPWTLPPDLASLVHTRSVKEYILNGLINTLNTKLDIYEGIAPSPRRETEREDEHLTVFRPSQPGLSKKSSLAPNSFSSSIVSSIGPQKVKFLITGIATASNILVSIHFELSRAALDFDPREISGIPSLTQEALSNYATKWQTKCSIIVERAEGIASMMEEVGQEERHHDFSQQNLDINQGLGLQSPVLSPTPIVAEPNLVTQTIVVSPSHIPPGLARDRQKRDLDWVSLQRLLDTLKRGQASESQRHHPGPVPC